MQLGYDRVFETWIPFRLKYKISDVGKNIRVKNKIFKNCIKVVGEGDTSYNVGPPLGNIYIKIDTIDWYAPGVGLIKTTRIEKSDSETMGEIKTTKFYE